MQAAIITDSDLFSIWEYGLQRPLIEKSLMLLAYAYPNFNIDELALLSIGDRDVRLLHIREQFFGPILHNGAHCTNCNQLIEWETSLETLKLQTIRNEKKQHLFEVNFENLAFGIRLPNSADILEISTIPEEQIQVKELIKKCLIQFPVTFNPQEELPEALTTAIVQKMEEQDPQADISMMINCPECSHSWNVFFDIMQYLWREIDDWANQLIQDIYLLASRFGWTEDEILRLSPFRRSLYLKMILA